MIERTRIADIAVYLPPYQRTNLEVETLLARHNPDLPLAAGLIESVTGVRTRRVAGEGVDASDLAVEAARQVLERTGTTLAEVDLLLFAAASQDLIEPATANLVQHKLGTRGAVFDLKNACNSFLNALQVGDALIRAGTYRRVLVAVGETPTRSVKWALRDRADFKLSFSGYTFGDAGAAALLVASEDERGIDYCAFRTASQYWDLATLPCGGSMHPRGDEYTYFRGESGRLKDAVVDFGPGILDEALAVTGTTYADYARILVHQVALPFLDTVLATGGIPREKVMLTLPEYGNMAAASLPVAYALAEARGEIMRGDRVLWFGQASGISLGVAVTRH